MSPHTDPRALLKLADEIEAHMSNLSDYDPSWGILIKSAKLVRQAASHGSAGGEAVAWRWRVSKDNDWRYAGYKPTVHAGGGVEVEPLFRAALKTGGEAQASNGGTTYSPIGRNADGIEVYKRDARPVDAGAAQEAKHCGASELERMERHKDILARALLLAQQEREIPLVAAAIKQAARHAGRDDAQSVDVESYLKEATIEECAAIASRYEGWQAENIAAQIRALALPSAAAPAQAGPDPLTRRERAEMIWAVLKSYMLDECSFDCAAVSPADEKNLINEIYNSIPNYSVPSAHRESTTVYLREVDAGTDSACWVVCNRTDADAVAFVGAA